MGVGDIFFWVGDGGEKGREARGKVGRNADRSVSQTSGRTGTGDWQLRELLEDLKQRPRLKKKKK